MKKQHIIVLLFAFTAFLALVTLPGPARATGVTYGEFPQKDAWTQATPSVVWGGDLESTTTLEVHIVKRKDVKRVWLTNLKTREPEGRMELFDDGTHGDKEADDNIFTLSQVVLSSNIDWSFYQTGYKNWWDFLRIELRDGTYLGQDYGMIVGTVNPKYKGGFPVTNFGKGLYATSYAFFIQDSEHKVIDSYPVSNVYCGTKNYNAYRKLYSVFPDVFDFALLMPGMQVFRPKELAENVPYNVMVSNKVKHIGLPLSDNTKSFGSAGRLKSVQYHSFGDVTILAHEIGHTWGMTLGQKLGLIEEAWDVDLGHWNHMADVQGQMGYYYFSDNTVGHFAYNGDETWRLIPNTTKEKFSPLELYVMGLIPSSEVPDVHILKDPDVSNPQRVTAKSFKTITMSQILKSDGGERIPAVNESQKEFNLAFIVTQDLPYNDAAFAYFSLLSQAAMRNEPWKSDRYSNPFNWATGGLATLSTYLGDFETLVKEK